MPLRLTFSAHLAVFLAAVSVFAGEVRPPVSDADRVASFLLHGEPGARSFVADGVDEAALGEVARAWSSQADKSRVAVLASVVIPGSSGEGRLVSALADWTDAGRIAASGEKEAAAAFLEAAAEQAGRLIVNPVYKKEIDAAVSGFDQSQAVERARRVSGRGLRPGAGVFGPDRNPGDVAVEESVPGGRRGGASGTSVTASAFLASADSAGPPGGPGGALAASRGVPAAAYLPAASLPQNFRNRKNVDVPSPTADRNPSLGAGSAAVMSGGIAGSVDQRDALGMRGASKEVGDAELRAVFNSTVARLVKEGKRRPGKGSLNGIVNNMSASLGPGSKYIRCYDQAEVLLGDLAEQLPAKSGWTFRMATYTGEGHEANGHYWVTAVAEKRETPTLIMDPWLGEIRTNPSKDPVVIKPFLPWVMGATMDKILP